MKVKRMLYLSGRSDFKTGRNNCAAQDVFATAAAIWSGFVLRKTLFKKSADALPNNVAEALNRWKGAHLIGFNNALSIAVFGAVLKFMGSTWYVAGIFFGLSLVFLLSWGPRQMAAQTVLTT
jgi:hypothetical protein